MLIKILFGDYLEMLFIQISKEILKIQRYVINVVKDSLLKIKTITVVNIVTIVN